MNTQTATMDDRIRLCEAMGWTPQPNEPNGEPVWVGPDDECPCYLYELPDPFHDANDDYAVLEWMRDNPMFDSYKIYLGNRWDYQIGDYARAALRVIDNG